MCEKWFFLSSVFVLAEKKTVSLKRLLCGFSYSQFVPPRCSVFDVVRENYCSLLNSLNLHETGEKKRRDTFRFSDSQKAQKSSKTIPNHLEEVQNASSQTGSNTQMILETKLSIKTLDRT